MSSNFLIDMVLDRSTINNLNTKYNLILPLIQEYLDRYESARDEELISLDISKVFGTITFVAKWRNYGGRIRRENISCDEILPIVVDLLSTEKRELNYSLEKLDKIGQYLINCQNRELLKQADFLESLLHDMLSEDHLYGSFQVQICQNVQDLEREIILQDHLDYNFFECERDLSQPISLDSLQDKAKNRDLSAVDLAYVSVALQELETKFKNHKNESHPQVFTVLSENNKYEVAYYSHCIDKLRQLNYSLCNQGLSKNPEISDRLWRQNILEKIKNGELISTSEYNVVRFSSLNYPLQKQSKLSMECELAKLQDLQEAYNFLNRVGIYHASDDDSHRLQLAIELYEGVLNNKEMSNWQEYYERITKFITECLTDLINLGMIPAQFKSEDLDYLQYVLELLKCTLNNEVKQKMYTNIDIQILFIKIIGYIRHISDLKQHNNIYAYSKIIELFGQLYHCYDVLCQLISLANLNGKYHSAMMAISQFIDNNSNHFPEKYQDDIKKNIYRLNY